MVYLGTDSQGHSGGLGEYAFSSSSRIAMRLRLLWLRRCPAMWLPPADPQGPDVLAGMFAGSVVREDEDGQWLELPGTEEVMNLLTEWTILFSARRSFRGRPRIGVSPFFGALFARMMPINSRQRVLRVARPAMCPLLPVLYWEWVFCRRGQRMLPSPRALPFGCSRRTLFRHGWGRRQTNLHRVAIETGICHITQGLRALMMRWFAEHVPDPCSTRWAVCPQFAGEGCGGGFANIARCVAFQRLRAGFGLGQRGVRARLVTKQNEHSVS